MDVVLGVMMAVVLLLWNTLELWLAPHQGSFFKGLKKKLAVVLPLYILSFGIWYFFFSA